MALDHAKLEAVRARGDGIQARCPACAESGGDTKGEHLRIDGQGRFGCAVHPGDHDHRRRIWALAGDGGKLPVSVVKVRAVALRRAWQFSDASDGTFQVGRELERNRPRFSDASDGTFHPLAVLVKCCSGERVVDHPSEASEVQIGMKLRTPHSAPVLVPLDTPFVEGARYRMAGATDARNRLDLYVADATGPWLRRHGTLMRWEAKS